MNKKVYEKMISFFRDDKKKHVSSIFEIGCGHSSFISHESFVDVRGFDYYYGLDISQYLINKKSCITMPSSLRVTLAQGDIRDFISREKAIPIVPDAVILDDFFTDQDEDLCKDLIEWLSFLDAKLFISLSFKENKKSDKEAYQYLKAKDFIYNVVSRYFHVKAPFFEYKLQGDLFFKCTQRDKFGFK